MNALNLVTWIVQILLAVFFLGVGTPKILGRGLERWAGFSALPRSLVIFIGLVEAVGAAGLVLPMATGILSWLTPLASLGLSIVVLMAAGFHLRADERLLALQTTLLAAVAAVITVSRWNLVSSHMRVAPRVSIVAFGVLVPAAVVNLVIIFVRSSKQGTPTQLP